MTQKNDTVDFFIRKARLGDAEAQYHLGSIYYYGLYDEPKNFELAEEWYRKSAEQGNADAQYMYGKMCELYGENEQAVEWYRKSAEQGKADAQYSLGKMYDYGWFVPKTMKLYSDKHLAAVWYHKSAGQGNKYALSKLEIMAEIGHVEAQYLLGKMFYHGHGVQSDAEVAIMWFRNAAEQGNV